MGFRSWEAAAGWRFIASSLDRLVDLGAALDPAGLAWRPPAPGANSVAALVRHTLGNAEENLLGVLCGEAVARERAAEFAPTASPDDLSAAWVALRLRLEACLASVSAADLARQRVHPRRGPVSGLDVLLIVARHAAEHLGQAELTRDLWLAGRDA